MQWTPVDTLFVTLISGLGAILRFDRLGDPRSLVFDETYYARDACWYARSSATLCKVGGEQTQVHPPLGKWLLAAGIKLWGYDSMGWRIGAAAAGTITIALLYLLAKRLMRSTMAAAVASGLLAFDFLHFVQSRIAMLDVFVPLFGVAAVLFAVLDRDRLVGEGGRVPRGRRLIGGVAARPWRLGAGAAAGAAMASKWSGGFYVALVLALAVAWEVGARRRDGRGGGAGRVLREEGVSILVALVVLPAVVYAATYAGRLEGDLVALPWTVGSWYRALWDRQIYMFDFHEQLRATHPYQSPAWTWPLLKRPVSYFFKTTPTGDYREILATGSPLVWWASIPALVYVIVTWARSRDPARPEGVILAGFVFNYAPWLVVAGGRSAIFFFYMLPALPFMCLALAYVPARMTDIVNRRWLIASFSAAVIGLFGFYYPVLADASIPRESWLERIWVFDDCERPPAPGVVTSSGTSPGTQGATTPNPAPSGWCWI